MDSSKFNRTVRILRVACPLALFAALVLGGLSYARGNLELVAVNAFLAGVNVVLTWVQWRVFKIQED